MDATSWYGMAVSTNARTRQIVEAIPSYQLAIPLLPNLRNTEKLWQKKYNATKSIKPQFHPIPELIPIKENFDTDRLFVGV